MVGSAARSWPFVRRSRGRPPTRRAPRSPTSRPPGAAAVGRWLPGAAPGAHPQQPHLCAHGPLLHPPGCVTRDRFDATVTASRTFSEAHPAFRGSWGEEAVPVAQAPEPVFSSLSGWDLAHDSPILQSSAPRLGARTRSRHGPEAVNDTGNASVGGRLRDWEGSKKNER